MVAEVGGAEPLVGRQHAPERGVQHHQRRRRGQDAHRGDRLVAAAPAARSAHVRPAAVRRARGRPPPPVLNSARQVSAAPTRPAASSPRPSPMRSDRARVSAWPTPKSKTPKTPTRASARVNRPQRSRPSWCTRNGVSSRARMSAGRGPRRSRQPRRSWCVPGYGSWGGPSIPFRRGAGPRGRGRGSMPRRRGVAAPPARVKGRPVSGRRSIGAAARQDDHRGA